MNSQYNAELLSLINNLPCQYQNIYGHPEFDKQTRGIRCAEIRDNIIEIIKQYKELTGKNKIKILDIGCAQGFFSLECAKMELDVTGIDFENKNIDLCKFLNKEFNLSAKFQRKILDLEFVKSLNDNEYDIIFLFNIIHHVANGFSYGRKVNGYNYAKKVMKILSKKCKILLGIYASSEENFPWAKSIAQNYRAWISDFKYSNEVGFVYVKGAQQNLFRPFIFSSNSFSYENKCLKFLDSKKKSCCENNLLFIKNSNNRLVVVVVVDMLTKYPGIPIGYLKGMGLIKKHDFDESGKIFYLDKYRFDTKIKLKKYYEKLLNKNKLGIVHSLRCGRIIQTSFIENKHNLIIQRKSIGTKSKINNLHYELELNNSTRAYLKGELVIDILDMVKENEEAFLDELEKFVGQLFLEFNYNGNLLQPQAYDLVPINCLKLDNQRYYFFDFEFRLKTGVDKSFIVYKILSYTLTYLNKNENLEKYYDYFANKFNLEHKLSWCRYYEKNYTRFVCNMYEGESWEEYNNAYKTRFIKKVIKLLTLPIPIKNLRKKFRTKLTRFIIYPNFRIAKRVGLGA